MYYRLIGDAENFRNYVMVGYSQEYANTFDGSSHAKTYQPQTFKLTKESEKNIPLQILKQVICLYVVKRQKML